MHLGRALLIASALAAAPTPRPLTPDDAIVVTGRKSPPEVTRARAVEFVRAAGVAAGEQSVARWVDPVCPRVLNLAEPYAQIVEAKLRAVAEETKIPLARQPCRPNIVISFASEAGAVVRRIAKKSLRSMVEIGASERARLLGGDAPVRWWYSTETKGSDGMAQIVGGAPWTSGNSEGGGSSLPSGVPTLQQYRSTIIGTQTVRVLKAATVIVDVGAADGVPLEAVASYAAMVAFAEIKPATPPPQSILGLFDGADRPRGLTAWDTAFLRALYRLPHDRRAGEQRRILVRELIAAADR